MRDHEAIIRKLIADGNESPKVDFKSQFDFSKRKIVELALK